MLDDKELTDIAVSVIPTVDEIISQSERDLAVSPQQDFDAALEEAESCAYKIYLKYEQEALLRLAEEWIKKTPSLRDDLLGALQLEGVEFVRRLAEIYAQFGKCVRALESRLGQMRKARGGRTFHLLVKRLLERCGVKCEIPTGKARDKLGRVDIVVPGAETALKRPDDAFFITCKRTLRERWRQEVPHGRVQWRYYLVTMDEDLSTQKAEEIYESGLIIFVRDSVKQREEFRKVEYVRSLKNLPRTLK